VKTFGDDAMRKLLNSASAAAMLLIATLPARSQEIPKLNVDPVCRGIAQQAATPGEVGGPDLSFRRCVKSEMAMRHKLAGKWAMYTRNEKTNCIGSESGGFASYTDLATCLQMAKQARQFNQ
jgi:hypothetical protein